jgi:hypothetical protein
MVWDAVPDRKKAAIDVFNKTLPAPTAEGVVVCPSEPELRCCRRLLQLRSVPRSSKSQLPIHLHPPEMWSLRPDIADTDGFLFAELQPTTPPPMKRTCTHEGHSQKFGTLLAPTRPPINCYCFSTNQTNSDRITFDGPCYISICFRVFFTSYDNNMRPID